MKTLKSRFFIATFIFIGGALFVNAQDMIILKDGNVIEAKVIEISPSEIKYKRFDHLDGPTIVIPAANVLSIKYENGSHEIITTVHVTEQRNTQSSRSQNTAIDPNNFIFGINANAGGAIGYVYSGGAGTGINIELGKGNFNSEINLMLPSSGFGALFMFNYFLHSRIGGFYLGGGLGYIFTAKVHSNKYSDLYWGSHINTLGLNLGYKFILPSGLYFRTGAYVAAGIDWASKWTDLNYGLFNFIFYIKPDLAIGWTMK